MNYPAYVIANMINQTTDPLVCLEIASTWKRQEIEEAIAECKELAAEGDEDDIAPAIERLAILELCSNPAFVAGCKAHWDKLDAMLNAA